MTMGAAMPALPLLLLLLAAPALAQAPQAILPPVEAAPSAAPVSLAPAAPARPAFAPATAHETLAAVRAAAAEGLAPGDYGAARLEAALAGADPAELDSAAAASWLALARAYAAGHTPLEARIGWKSPPPRSDPAFLEAKLAEALAAGTPRAALEALLPTHGHDGLLKKALAASKDPAERARLRANLDRWRWMPRNLGDRYLMANVPAFEVDLWEAGRPVARHRIIVGKTNLATPQFSAAATAIVMNPEWNLPDSIVKESVGSLIRRSPGAARARGYSWTAGADGRLYVKQAPGPRNSLGKMKIEMPNSYAIYFHDTPAKQLFAKEVRAFSHGCMRTQGILGLALRLLEDQPSWDAAAIDAAVATGQNQRVPLTTQLPVHIAYFTTVPGAGGTVRTYPDIYGRDGPVIAALG
jgi:murein L,D-transpeptidase YcbB/YkuD